MKNAQNLFFALVAVFAVLSIFVLVPIETIFAVMFIVLGVVGVAALVKNLVGDVVRAFK